MARAIHWQIPFVSFKGVAYTVNIYEDDYEGDVVTLTGSASPITIDEDEDDDAFLPVRTSSGYINLVIEDVSIIEDIMPSATFDRYVEVVKASTVVWNGYITPEEFSDDWKCAPIEVSFPLQSVAATLKQIDYEAQYDIVSIPDILSEICSECNYIDIDLSSYYIDDSIFADEADKDWHTYLGVNGNVSLPENRRSQYDVVEEICKYFGIQCREINGVFTFMYIDQEGTRTSGALSNDIIISADGKRDYVQGKRFISITESVNEPPDPIDIDAAHKSSSYATLYNNGSVWVSYPNSVDQVTTYQYDSDGNDATIDLLNEHVNNRGLYCGANLVRIRRGYEWLESFFTSHGTDDSDEYKSGIIVKGNTSYNSKPFAVFRSKHNLCGRSYSGGLKISAQAVMDPAQGEAADWSKNPNTRVSMEIKWGDKYYDRTTDSWVDTQAYINPYASEKPFGEGTGEGTGYLVGNWHKEPGTEWIINKGYVYIPSDDSLYGKLEIILHGFGSSGISLLEGMAVENARENSVVISSDINLSENHYRQELSGKHLDTYDVSTYLCTKLDDNQISNGFVLTSDGYAPRQLKLDYLSRLTQWYSRTIEKITVTVRDDAELSPLTLLTYGEDTYTIVAMSHNYRDSQTTLTLQKLP